MPKRAAVSATGISAVLSRAPTARAIQHSGQYKFTCITEATNNSAIFLGNIKTEVLPHMTFLHVAILLFGLAASPQRA